MIRGQDSILMAAVGLIFLSPQYQEWSCELLGLKIAYAWLMLGADHLVIERDLAMVVEWIQGC